MITADGLDSMTVEFMEFVDCEPWEVIDIPADRVEIDQDKACEEAEEARRLKDWSGSSGQRREQMHCPANHQIFVIEAGTEVLVARRHDRKPTWVKHTTRIRLEFRSIAHGTKQFFDFLKDDWVIRVRIARVTGTA